MSIVVGALVIIFSSASMAGQDVLWLIGPDQPMQASTNTPHHPVMKASPTNAVTAKTVESPSQPSDGYRIHPGDKLKITVYREADLSGMFTVAGDGVIQLPLIGGVSLNGLTVAEAQNAIADHYRNGYLKQPQVMLEIAQYRPFYIMGGVKNPGSYHYVEGMRVINAVATGGGFTGKAKTGRVRLIRDGMRFDQPLTVTPDTMVQPGDIITVNERIF